MMRIPSQFFANNRTIMKLTSLIQQKRMKLFILFLISLLAVGCVSQYLYSVTYSSNDCKITDWSFQQITPIGKCIPNLRGTYNKVQLNSDNATFISLLCTYRNCTSCTANTGYIYGCNNNGLLSYSTTLINSPKDVAQNFMHDVQLTETYEPMDTTCSGEYELTVINTTTCHPYLQTAYATSFCYGNVVTTNVCEYTCTTCKTVNTTLVTGCVNRTATMCATSWS